MRPRVAQVLVLFLVTGALFAAEPPKIDPKVDPKAELKTDEDPIAAQLLKDKEAYIAGLDKAREDVLKAFDKYYESVKANKSLKIEAQLAQLEKIEADKKLFEDGGILPAAPAMKVAVSEYRTAQKKAEVVVKAAFEKAAKAYRDKNDVKAAGATLEEMKEFLAKTPTAAGGAAGAGAAVPIQCGHTNKVLLPDGGSPDDGAKIVIGDYAKGDQTQLWKVVAHGDGFVYIENAKSGLVITAKGKGNGAEIALGKKQTPASDAQLWKIVPVPTIKDAQKVFSKAGGKLWAVDNRSTENGARLLLWTDAAPKVEHAHMFGFLAPK